MQIKRYTLDRTYANNIGVPGVIESKDGEYVRFDQHKQILSACEAHNELQLLRLRKRRDEQAVQPSHTQGMSLGERIAHVGGRTNAEGYIEFGSPMAVNALIQHVLRDAPAAAKPFSDPTPPAAVQIGPTDI